jgi:phenol 2-monooxygenase (NADPH)
MKNFPFYFDHIGPGTFFLHSLWLSIIFDSHITRVFIDDRDLKGVSGGDGYKNYGIDSKTGAIVIVRPDGYVGMISPLNKTGDIAMYFGSFCD